MADHRFSLFGHKKDSRSQNDLQHDVGGDSAYASSGNAPSLADSKDTVPVENHGQINGVDGDRHLAMNKSTGQIFDDDTGEAVTVVTTTTTTTTTTTRGGKKGTTVDVSTQPSDQSTNSSSVHEAPGDHPGRPEAHNLYGHARPEATAPSQRTAAPEPIVPVRNPNRKSRDYEARRSGDQAWPGFGAYDAPPSPHNFSYPSRSDLRSPEDEHPPQLTPGPAAAPAPKRTLDSLKAAAIGIHVSSTFVSFRSVSLTHPRALARPYEVHSTMSLTLVSQGIMPKKRPRPTQRTKLRWNVGTEKWQPCSAVIDFQARACDLSAEYLPVKRECLYEGKRHLRTLRIVP